MTNFLSGSPATKRAVKVSHINATFPLQAEQTNTDGNLVVHWSKSEQVRDKECSFLQKDTMDCALLTVSSVDYQIMC